MTKRHVGMAFGVENAAAGTLGCGAEIGGVCVAIAQNIAP
jgi:hypothetical protein